MVHVLISPEILTLETNKTHVELHFPAYVTGRSLNRDGSAWETKYLLSVAEVLCLDRALLTSFTVQ